MTFFVFILQPILGNDSYQSKILFISPTLMFVLGCYCHSFIDFHLEKVNFPGTSDVIIQRWRRCYMFIKNDPQEWFRNQGTLIFFASVILLVCLHAWIECWFKLIFCKWSIAGRICSKYCNKANLHHVIIFEIHTLTVGHKSLSRLHFSCWFCFVFR